jgi:hypothetical protein
MGQAIYSQTPDPLPKQPTSMPCHAFVNSWPDLPPAQPNPCTSCMGRGTNIVYPELQCLVCEEGMALQIGFLYVHMGAEWTILNNRNKSCTSRLTMSCSTLDPSGALAFY